MASRIQCVAMAVVLLGFLTPRAASACDEAERLRLSDEIQGLAQKNAWTGVERKYAELLKTKCDLKFEQYSLGAESAKNLGKTFEMWERLEGAKAIDPQEDLDAAVTQIETNYGRVEIRGDARRRAPLLREEMPFPPDQRKSIEYAQSVVQGTGSFKGMLPNGDYKIADKELSVSADQSGWQIITVGKGKNGPVGDPKDEVKREGLINWAGPIALVGTGFFGSAAPRDPVYAKDGKGPTLTAAPIVGDPQLPGYPCPDEEGNANEDRAVQDEGGNIVGCLSTVRTPETIGLFSTPNLSLTIGGELGLTYKAPEAGVVGTLTYRRMFGNSLNQLTFHVGAVVRPGDFRITAGPTWGLVFGGGRGYAQWTDEGQGSGGDFRLEQERFRGVAMGGGMAGSFGYAVFDVGPFQGLIELDGHWQRDNIRNYSGFGLRLGIVPKIDRFEG